MNNKQLKEVQNFIKEAVEWLITEQEGCSTLKLDNRLALCVGWQSGYGKEKRSDIIQSTTEPDYAIVAGLKVYTSDYMLTDYDYINYPYYKNGGTLDNDISITPEDIKDNFKNIATYLLKQFENLKDLSIAEDGQIEEN